MLITEALIRKRYVKLQIEELKNYLTSDGEVPNVNDVLSKLYKLEDQNQRYKILLDKVNRKFRIEIGSSDVSIATAVELRENTLNKIESLTELISANKESLDIFNLFDQRNKLLEEYIMIAKAIKMSDWSHTID